MKILTLTSKQIPFDKERFYQKYRELSQAYQHHVLLESGRGGRYNIAAFGPETIFLGKNNKLTIVDKGREQELPGNPLHLMKEYMAQYKLERQEGLPDFQGGLIGYISYDYVRYIERLPKFSSDDLEMPEVYFLLFNEWFVFDHEEETLWLLQITEKGHENTNALNEWESKWTGPVVKIEQNRMIPNNDELHVSMSDEQFMKAVERIQEYIAQGDIFQVNLSVRQAKAISIPAVNVYDQLRQLNPSPYMSYLHTPEFQIVGGSPELLVKKHGKEVSTRPIAGTRSRGENEEEDLRLAKELIENEKERAEHVMLVDLERNDLGRVCEYGTVEVNEFMVIERYSHVMHIVSNVRGVIRPDQTSFDLIDAAFPGGTITGAPKVRTMEIIEELEPVQRGIYTGSMGWIGFDDDMEINIVIRTMLVKDGQAFVQAGAGIVIDSNPKHEYKESLKKAMALWRAKELAEKGEFH
ncbi:anthranilate synthase component I family protein [Robertmurraya korlensis]|uniref:anthranilate synthase component I family protein n=1 Tax=Robertmurraya korlensis TaxID=519977 RepID=UPI0020405FA7|nr:anthranilate synthase component I family protein [Robertmurraya korlensis]MCM3603624.1 anthranilate synthase component I family protein [Robertmurraya korlensis]